MNPSPKLSCCSLDHEMSGVGLTVLARARFTGLESNVLVSLGSGCADDVWQQNA